MPKGSQLSQLKSALNQAGLNNKPNSGKKRKRPESNEYTKDKKAKKLQAIHEKLNPFDVKVTKLKHDIPGRKLKGVTGRPQESRQAGIEQRKKTLLQEFESKGRAGGFVDRRFGENDPTMTPEERMLERFTKERQRASKGALFNLEDEDDLTHYGQSLSMMDDFDATGLNADQDSDSDGKIDQRTVSKVHFGGFGDEENEENEDEPERKKSKAEVMQEVIAKSKQHKAERQAQRQEDSEIRHQLDQELDDIRGLLFDNPIDVASSSIAKESRGEDKDYDQHVRELALDKRARPKDRAKTEEELAVEAKEALEKAERKRQKRMRGESESESDDERTSRRKDRRKIGGDDLEDDFEAEAEDEEWHGLGMGLDAEENEDATVGRLRTTKDDDSGGEEEGTDVEEGDNSSDSESESESGSEEDGSTSSYENGSDIDLPAAKSTNRSKAKEEIPFTFPCPSTLDELLEIVGEADSNNIVTIVKRVRTLYHPSLDKDNKLKLQAFIGVLIDYVLHIAALSSSPFSTLPSILPHIHSLATSYPIPAAEHFISKLKLMQKNLSRGLSKGPTLPTSKTWPGSSELAFFWIISHIWPTSDMNHHVVSPARLLMGSYLSLCRIRSIEDVSRGLFLCTLFLQYEEHSKRLVPEVVTFLLNSLLHLGVHKFPTETGLRGSFPCPDFANNRISDICVTKTKARAKAMKTLEPQAPDFNQVIKGFGKFDGQTCLNLLSLSLQLLEKFADLYKGLDGFTELFETVVYILDNFDVNWASEGFKRSFSNSFQVIQRLLKFAKQSKRHLALQAHKPIPIATYIPKFESTSSDYMRQKDPDDERAAASKLRYQYKQERKGAIRELRKDARFLSAVQHQKQQSKDKAYADRMNKVFSTLQSERAEQKQMEREKNREKRRAGRK